MNDPDRGVLRFITCGSVDDGKSTLIGRLLYDCRALLADALDRLARASRARGAPAMDLSLVTDGLRAEREQGITIDVAYRYFATGVRTFILGDAPGHEQYTRNMVTAASTADLAVLLVDARRGVLTQTRRHAALACLLGVPHLVVAVNKMDLVGWSRDAFEAVQAGFQPLARELGADFRFVPMSALEGDGVVVRGAHLDWYRGPTLLELLESAPLPVDDLTRPFRFPVQWICRPRGGPAGDYRGCAGRVAAGTIRVGDPVSVLPDRVATRVRSLRMGTADLPAARRGQSVLLELADPLDVARGALLAAPESSPPVGRRLAATLCWLAEAPARPGARYRLRTGTRETGAILEAVTTRLDMATLATVPADRADLNDLVEATLTLQAPVATDLFAREAGTGTLILMNETDHATVAAGLVRELA